jgi:hypothetical protein
MREIEEIVDIQFGESLGIDAAALLAGIAASEAASEISQLAAQAGEPVLVAHELVHERRTHHDLADRLDEQPCFLALRPGPDRGEQPQRREDAWIARQPDGGVEAGTRDAREGVARLRVVSRLRNDEEAFGADIPTCDEDRVGVQMARLLLVQPEAQIG